MCIRDSLYPLYFIVIASVSDPVAINNGQVRLLPMGFNLDGYRKILEDGKIWTAYNNTVFYTVVGTSVNIILTMLIAYPLSRQNFFIRRGLMAFMMFTMYFQGGMIPTYLLMQKLNLYNTPWVMILLPAINVFNVIIATSNIRENIPNELYEAASIDGCSHFGFFFRMVLPLLSLIHIYKKAYFDYFIDEKYEAGIELFGTEVKSIRMGKCSVKESFVKVDRGEMYICGMHVSPYEKGNIFNKDPLRVRKLLLHKYEILKIGGKIKEKGYTLVPLRVYFKGSLVKVEIGLARGKKNYDKRADIAKKDQRRELEKDFKVKNLY